MPDSCSALRALYYETLEQISSPDQWQAFLKTAAFNYKLEFHEQAMIFAQKPEATIVMPASDWQKYSRNVMEEKAILILDVLEDKTYSLFDISDTAANRESISVPVFQINPDTGQVLAYVNSALDLEEKELSDAVFTACDLATEQQLENVFEEAASVLQETAASHFSASLLKSRLSRFISNSAAYMCLIRCGYPAEQILTAANFRDINIFGTAAIAIIGSVINQAVLDVMRTVIRASRRVDQEMYETQNRTFAAPDKTGYNRDELKERQGDQNGTQLFRQTEAGLHQETPPWLLHRNGNARQAEGTPSDTPDAGRGSLGAPDRTESGKLGRDRGTESERPGEMDRPDDQSERDDAGTGAQRDDLQLNIPTQQAAESETVLPLSISQEEIDNVLLRGSLVSDGKYRIFEQFQKQETTKENAAFLKKEYGIGGYAAPGSPMVNFRGKGIEIISNDSNRKIDLSWNQAAIRIQQLIEANRYFTPLEAERYAEYISAKTSVPETSVTDMDMPQPVDHISYDYHTGDQVFIGTKQFEILATEPEIVVSDVTFPLFSQRYGKDDFEKKLAENPFNTRLIKNTAEETPEDSQIMKTEPDETENAGVPYTDAFFIDSENQTVTWMYYNPDSTAGGQYVTNTFGFAEISQTAKGSKTSDEFFDRLGSIADQTLADVGTDWFEEAKNQFLQEPDFTDCTEATMQGLVAAAAIPEEIKDTENLPYITCEWSEHPGFNDGQSYSIYEFDTRMKLYNAEWRDKRQKVLDEYGSADAAFKAEADGYGYLGYAKTKFTVHMPDGTTYTERQDIGDADGGVIDFLKQYPAYRIVVPILEETVLRQKSESPSLSLWLEYSVLKQENEDHIVLYQVGDFFEAFGDDAKMVAEICNLTLTQRRIYKGRRINMCGFPANRLENYANALTDAGHRLAVAALENGERITRTLVSTREAETVPAQETAKPNPPAEAATDNYVIRNDSIGEGGAKERFRKNIAAIRLLKALEHEQRGAAQEEQEVLVQYVGWGGLSDAFDDTKANWSNEYQTLKEMLTAEEYTAARASVLTAFYTPPVVIRAIYQALENMGFQSGNICDPACGTGHFIGMLPQTMSGSKFYGVELDSISGRIAQKLYPKASIAVQGFEDTTIPDSFLDVIVGNVPFGDIKVYDEQYNKLNFRIHDYFVAKSLDKLRPGGVLAFITSKGTLDKDNPAVRKYIAERAELIGAIRLPDNTFKRAAGTEVTSDILFLKKRERRVIDEPEWVYLGEDENGIAINQYFIDHPEMILGHMVMESTQHGRLDSACKADPSSSLETQLQQAITHLHAEIDNIPLAETEAVNTDDSIPADPSVRNFSYCVVGGEVYYRVNARMEKQNITKKKADRIKGMISIRDSVRRLLDLQVENASDQDIKAEQDTLNRLYDTFTAKNDALCSFANRVAFREDASSPLLLALEKVDEDGNVTGKSDIFFKRTIRAYQPVTHADTSVDALAISISEKGKIDLPFMRQLTGKSEDELVQELSGIIFLNPDYLQDSNAPQYLTSEEYLSGNVRKKLEEAKELSKSDPLFEINAQALEKVQPEDLTAAEISVRLGSSWIPEDVINDFIYQLLDTPFWKRGSIQARYNPLIGEWKISNRSSDSDNEKAKSTYGTKRAHAYRIIEDTLNLRDTRIFDTVYDLDGKEKSVLNAKETAVAQSKQEAIRQAFLSWIWKEPDRRNRLCRLYNDKFNCIRPREYDGSHIVYHGMNPQITFRPHQNDAVAHILYGKNVLLAHVVGAGKTFEIAAAAMEGKFLGQFQKSIIVVPNHLTEQWASEFLLLYPNANLLVAKRSDFEKENRKRFCSKIATGDFDAIIIGQSQFEKIPMSLENQKKMISRQISELEQGIEDAKAQNGEHFSVKAMERSKRALEDRLKRLTEQSRKDDVVTFEQLGVDKMFIDEAHFYKNLFLVTKMRNVAGIAQSEAQKSTDLFMKCQYLDELTGGKGTVFATGTPISNSMVELYTMQRYLQYDRLREMGMERFDEWASTFGETVTAMELAPEGTGYRFKTRFAKFNNLPELMSVFKEVADIRTADMLKLPVPKANYHNVVIKPSAFQKQYIESLADRAEAIHNRLVEPYQDNMLKVTNEGRKLALDERLIFPESILTEQTKIDVCAENVVNIWKETTENRSTQLIFCDLSTPTTDGSFNVYDKLKETLIHQGIPEDEIAFIHNAETEAKKKALFAQVREGKVRVLIGSTQKMGAGTNVQDRLIALHHLDCPWRPADLEQREGRIIRQGNQNSEVEIYRYATEATFDSYMWQLVENKQKFIAQIMTSKTPARSAEDVDETSLSYGEVKALASGNPMILEKCTLEAEIGKLNILKANFLNQKYELEDKILNYYPSALKKAEENIRNLSEDVALAAQHPVPKDEMYPITINGFVYQKRISAGENLIHLCKAMKPEEERAVGEYRGFSLSLIYQSGKFYAQLQHRKPHVVTLGIDPLGNIRRIENAINDLAVDLDDEKQEYSTLQKNFQAAKQEVKKEFLQEAELCEKNEKLAKINSLLTNSGNQKQKKERETVR